MRGVVDTNVIVSALLFRGTTSHLHAHWRANRLVLVVTEETVAELARVLAYPKFKLAPAVVESLVATEVLPFTERIAPTRAPPACRDPDDDEFLWCARDAGADALITGDPDLLALRPSWSGVPILTVVDALVKLDAAEPQP